MKRLGAVSAAMLDHLDAAALERARQDQIRIEKQLNTPRRRSILCVKGLRHASCYAVNCTCACHKEAA